MQGFNYLLMITSHDDMTTDMKPFKSFKDARREFMSLKRDAATDYEEVFVDKDTANQTLAMRCYNDTQITLSICVFKMVKGWQQVL